MTTEERIREVECRIKHRKDELKDMENLLEQLKKEEEEFKTGDVVAYRTDGQHHGADRGLKNRQIYFKCAETRTLYCGKGYVLCPDGAVLLDGGLKKLEENVFEGDCK